MLFKTLCKSLLLLSPALLLSACADSTKVDPYAGDPPAYIYATGHQALQKGHWSDALTAYQSLDSQYPFDPYTQKGDLDSIYAQYENNEPALAMTEANRYVKVYPNDPNGLAYAYYMMGVVNFDNGRGFLQRYFPYNMSQHDADNYTTAFNSLNTVIVNYPNSLYASDARRRMIYLNNSLAQYNINVAELSYQQGAYIAAANRAIAVILNYPTSPVTGSALAMLADCYEQLGLTDLQKSTQEVLDLNFPNKNIDDE